MTMIAMMPDDVAILIYKQVFQNTLDAIAMPKTQRMYGFTYHAKNVDEDDEHIMQIVDYLNNNVVKEYRLALFEDGCTENEYMDYYIIDANGDRIIISEDIYDDDCDNYYTYARCPDDYREISRKVLELALNTKNFDFYFIQYINARITRTNLNLRQESFIIPDHLPLDVQAMLYARLPKYSN